MSQSKADYLYLELKHDFYASKYEVGEIINEKKIAEDYGISKTPVREALALLAAEGFLVKFPRKGYFIKEINYKEYHELMQFRFLVEFGVARMIIGRCSNEEIQSLFKLTPHLTVNIDKFKVENRKFHEGMAGLLKNRYISATIAEVFDRSIRETSIEGFNRISEDMHQDHRRMVEAMLARNVETAGEILRRELARFGESSNIF